MNGSDEYLDTATVAQYLKMSPNTIRQYVSRGRIPFIKVPGSNLVRFSKNQIDQWMMQGVHSVECVAEEKEEYSGGGNGKDQKKEGSGRKIPA